MMDGRNQCFLCVVIVHIPESLRSFGEFILLSEMIVESKVCVDDADVDELLFKTLKLRPKLPLAISYSLAPLNFFL